MKAYLDYKPASLLCGIDKIPVHWNEVRNGCFFKEKNDNIGNEWEITQLLSLTKQGIIKRDMNSGKGKTHSDYSTYQRIAIGDFIFCLFDIDETPRTVGLSELSGMITSAYTCFQINEKANSKFIYYLYEMIDDKKALKPFYSGMRKTIRATDFLKIKIPFPPLAEQQKIAQFLDTKTAQIDALITEQNRLIELLTEQRKAVISHAVTKGLNPNAPMKKSGVEWLGEVPSGWQVGKIKHFATVNPKIKKFSLPENEMIEFIPMANVDDVLGVISDFEYRNFGEVSTGYTAFNSNDVVFAKITPCMENGNCAIIPNLKFNFGFGSTEFIVFRAKKEIMPEFLHLILRNDYLRKICKRFMSGVAGQQRISTEFLADYPVAIPPLAEQNKIVAYIEVQTAQIDALITEQKRLIERLKEYRTALISAAVTGKIDVQAA